MCAQAPKIAPGEISGVQIHRDNIQSGEIQLGYRKGCGRSRQSIVRGLNHKTTTRMRHSHCLVASAAHDFATLFLINRGLQIWNGTFQR